MEHISHPAVLKRHKGAQGDLASVIGMIEAGRPCIDLAQQLPAVESAIANAKRELIQDHIGHCLDEGMETDSKAAKTALAEFKMLAKYL